MKLTYFATGLVNHKTGEKCLFGLNDFLKCFCRLDNPSYKNSFIHNDEKLFLVPHIDDVYYFIMTKDQEIVRKINSQDFSLSAVKSLLEKNEHLGFASYLIVKDEYIGFGSTVFAPKVDVFANYINDLISSLGVKDVEFYIHALVHQATREEVQDFSHVGRTDIEVSRDNSVMQDILKVLGSDISDAHNLRAMKISFVPQQRQNIKDTVVDVMKDLPEDGLERFKMRARAEAGSQIMDLYLSGSGAVSDFINTKDEKKIAHEINQKTIGNKILKQKLEEYKEDEEFKESVSRTVLPFNKLNSWAAIIPSVYSGDEG